MKSDESRVKDGFVKLVSDNGEVSVELFCETNFEGGLKKGEWKINWGAYGSKPASFAREFSAVLDAAITKCDELNRTD